MNNMSNNINDGEDMSNGNERVDAYQESGLGK